MVNAEGQVAFNRTTVNKTLRHPDSTLDSIRTALPDDPHTMLLAGRADRLDAERIRQVLVMIGTKACRPTRVGIDNAGRLGSELINVLGSSHHTEAKGSLWHRPGTRHRSPSTPALHVGRVPQ